MSTPILQLIKNACHKFPERNAFCINDKFYTYISFAQMVSNIRDQLKARITPGERLIGVIANNDIETYCSIYAILYSGLGYVPINPSHTLERSSSIIQQAELKTILTSTTDDISNELARKNSAKLLVTSDLTNGEIDLTLPEINENDLAYVLFTSGSTGVPKGVPITRKNLDSFADAFFELGYKINEQDRFLQMFELTFDFSVICYVIPLCIGACIYTVSSSGVKYANVFNVLEEHQITFSCLVPSILSYLRPYFEEIRFEKMKYCLFCGEALYKQISEEWQDCNPNARIINAYGPTEATVFCLIYNWTDKSNTKTYNESLCIGKEMKDMLAICVDENLKVVPAGNKGELCLAGPQVTPGYWKNSEKNKEAFFNYSIKEIEYTFYRTGDLAFIDEEGDFLYCGRIDFQVKIDGFRIELGEIEYAARDASDNCNATAIPYQSKIGTTKIHLFLENFSGNLENIKAELEKRLPYYMVPSTISSIQNFPLNSNGKTDRKDLLKILEKSQLAL